MRDYNWRKYKKDLKFLKMCRMINPTHIFKYYRNVNGNAVKSINITTFIGDYKYVHEYFYSKNPGNKYRNVCRFSDECRVKDKVKLLKMLKEYGIK